MIRTEDRFKNMAASLPRLKKQLRRKKRKFAKQARRGGVIFKHLGKQAAKDPIGTKEALEKGFPVTSAALTLGGGLAASALLNSYAPGVGAAAETLISINSLSKRKRKRVVKDGQAVAPGIILFRDKLFSL